MDTTQFIKDRYGFNNPDKLWDEENIKRLDWRFIYGMSVFDKDSFRGNIENIQAGVINLGYSGNGPDRISH